MQIWFVAKVDQQSKVHKQIMQIKTNKQNKRSEQVLFTLSKCGIKCVCVHTVYVYSVVKNKKRCTCILIKI